MKLALRLLPPTYLYIYTAGAIVLHFLFPVAKIIPTPQNYFGVLLMIVGIVLNIWADSLFKKNETTVKPLEKPSSLITEGPFTLSRHPMYVGFVLFLLGLAILLGSVVAFIAPVVMFITLETVFISREEENLLESFGKEYLDYKKKVRRWL